MIELSKYQLGFSPAAGSTKSALVCQIAIRSKHQSKTNYSWAFCTDSVCYFTCGSYTRMRSWLKKAYGRFLSFYLFLTSCSYDLIFYFEKFNLCLYYLHWSELNPIDVIIVGINNALYFLLTRILIIWFSGIPESKNYNVMACEISKLWCYCASILLLLVVDCQELLFLHLPFLMIKQKPLMTVQAEVNWKLPVRRFDRVLKNISKTLWYFSDQDILLAIKNSNKNEKYQIGRSHPIPFYTRFITLIFPAWIT